MEKVKAKTGDLTQSNIRAIGELFPNVVTETRSQAGEVAFAVDFEMLRQELSDHVVDGTRERYQLDWPGKRASILLANAPTTSTLRPMLDESINFETTKNLFIEGDNLEALKLLQESYLGMVKLIYIDPPYNTGNDFVYDDDFAESIADYLSRTGQSDDAGTRLVANTESNGRFHSDWLSMMYPRLKLARNLLAPDGVIFVSIDSIELANLYRIMSEVFGEGNFRSNIIWQKRYTRSNNTQDFTAVVEYLLVFSRSSDFIVNLLPRTAEADARYSNPDNDPRGPWKGASFLNPATPAQRPNLCYPIANPNSGVVTMPTSNAWRRSREEFERLGKDNLLYWGADGLAPVPSVKMFLSEVRGLTPTNFWSHEYAGNTDNGTADLASLMGARVFDFPKPVLLMKRILEHASDKDSLVMDFFAGSGSFLQAVLEMNAEDMGTRRYIAVQVAEPVGESTSAFAEGFRTISELARERLRRVAAKVDGAELLTSGSSDVGFRALKVDSSTYVDVLHTPDDYSQSQLDVFADRVKADRTGEDLVIQVMLDWGLDLSLEVSAEVVAGTTVFNIGGGSVLACFERKVPLEIVRTMANRRPLRAVFRDSSFVDDAERVNVEQIFREVSKDTEVKVV